MVGCIWIYCVCFIVQRLESEKEELERDLSFKADQALQYDRLLETVREHNRQLQVGGATIKRHSIALHNFCKQYKINHTHDII